MISNLNYYFNVEYYKDLVESTTLDLKSSRQRMEQNVDMYNNGIREYIHISNKEVFIPANQIFNLKTSYPGLLIGIGNVHATGDIKEEIALGFTLDYVTGQPYIPGSTVKGVLRNKFRHWECIKEIAEEIKPDFAGNLNDSIIRKLELNVFGEDNERTDCPSAPNKRDIFFDAVISNGTSENTIMEFDNITPHRQSDELLELAEPNPLTLVKIRPNVEFEFRFRLQSNVIEGLEFDAFFKKKLFRRILFDFGIGAKTNVGYGYFDTKHFMESIKKEENEIKQLKIIEEQKEKEREEEEKILKMTDFERDLYLEEKKDGEKNIENWLNTKLIPRLDTCEQEDRIKLAEYLKNKWIEIGKWSGSLSDKQAKKVEKIKAILKE
ncbi:UNVERIFIED_CONTAM: CRISPR type III-B/RAMP module RAMP protein Cmr6 [Acetivibrio alkalicellulosi]